MPERISTAAPNYWNYRLVNRDSWIAVYEVYFTEAGVPFSTSAQPAAPMGQSMGELERVLGEFKDAAALPVFEWDSFPQHED